MQAFDEAHRAVHYPADRRFCVWINPWLAITAGLLVLGLVLIAWGQFLLVGLPGGISFPPVDPAHPPSPHGFPLWLRLSHFLNFFLSCS